jgi:hypothetical protein
MQRNRVITHHATSKAPKDPLEYAKWEKENECPHCNGYGLRCPDPECDFTFES